MSPLHARLRAVPSACHESSRTRCGERPLRALRTSGSDSPACLLQTWTQTTTYLQLVGILLGQVFFGVMGDAVGRKAAMLTDMVSGRGGAIGCYLSRP